MKIKVTDKSYSEVKQIPKMKHEKPIKQTQFWRNIMLLASLPELNATHFQFSEFNMDKLGPDEPALFLMNHSSFTDLQIAAKLLHKRQYHIVMTNDGMVGKSGLMRKIGCIPTKKFITDSTLVRDMKYAFDTLKSTVLMYPEASYSFDGTTTPLPDSIGKCIKLCGVPVVMIKTQGAFLRDPLYNNLQKRKVDVSATMTYLLSRQDIKTKTADEIMEIINQEFQYNHFAKQQQDNLLITEDFRADGLERVLYKCPCCKDETSMLGKGTSITCRACGDTHILKENGTLERITSDESLPLTTSVKSFSSIPEWYAWERECVREELRSKTYCLDLDVDILMLVDFKSMYHVGCGHLTHNQNGFTLTGCNGELEYAQSTKSSYSLYSDYYWYEIGDMISIGDANAQYYCFPKKNEASGITPTIPVAKARIAAEELYKM